MKILEKVTANTVFAIHVMLVFMLIFESQVSIPVFLQPLGRMHPLLLHFPIGLLVLIGLFQFFRKEIEPNSFRKIQRFTLYITVFTTALTAIMGFFLSQEEGYASNMMTLHKWTGITVSFLAYGLLLLEPYQQSIKWAFPATLTASVIVLLFAGHFGASITHGADFVWAPLISDKVEITEETPIFEAAIQPVLKDKCYACHNDSKTKGDLNMSSREKLMNGGKNGAIWKAGDAMNSHMIQRANLPLDHEEHMPPEGKTQLTQAEIDLLTLWIDSGADTEIAFKDLPAEDSLHQLAMNYVAQTLEVSPQEPKYEFTFASDKTLDELNNPFRTVSPISSSSPALEAQIFVRQAYQDNYLSDLAKVRDQIVSLNLTNLPIQDEDIATITQFSNLEKILLNGTDITGETLSELSACQKLRSLAVSGTQTGQNLEKALKIIPSLSEVFVWNTQLTDRQIDDLQIQYPNIGFHHGYIPDESELLSLSPPLLVNDSKVLRPGEKVRLRNSFPGAEIRYTLNGTEPDSLESPVYEEPLEIPIFTTIQARTFREGWISSSSVEFSFFIDGFKPVNAELLYDSDPEYSGRGAYTLIDGKKGFASGFRSPDWLGFKENPLIATLDFGENPPLIHYLTISYAQNIFSYLMPPQSVELWGGDHPEQMKLLTKLYPKQPENYQKTGVKGINLSIPESDFRYYKLVARPVSQLPSWHRGKGKKGWIFVDEIFAY